MNPIDTYRDTFLKFLADGMSYAEAFEQFDEKEWRKAVIAELDDGQTRLDRESGELVTNDERYLPALLSLGARADFERRSIRDFNEQAVPLMLAGWTSEVANPTNSKHFWSQVQTMSLYWRAPSKRAGKPGRRYLSTQQAYNAMMRGK